MTRRRPVTNEPGRHLSYPEALADDVAARAASRRPGGRGGLMRASRLLWPTVLVVLALTTGACSGSSPAPGNAHAESDNGNGAGRHTLQRLTEPKRFDGPRYRRQGGLRAYVAGRRSCVRQPGEGNADAVERSGDQRRADLPAVAVGGCCARIKVHQQGSPVKKMTVTSATPRAGSASLRFS